MSKCSSVENWEDFDYAIIYSPLWYNVISAQFKSLALMVWGCISSNDMQVLELETIKVEKYMLPSRLQLFSGKAWHIPDFRKTYCIHYNRSFMDCCKKKKLKKKIKHGPVTIILDVLLPLN